MGLLGMGYNKKLLRTATAIFDEEMAICEKYNITLNEDQKETIFEGTIHHIISLGVATALNEGKIHKFYTDWTYALLHNHVKGLDTSHIKAYLIGHYSLMLKYISEILPPESIEKGSALLQSAIDQIQNDIEIKFGVDYINNGEYAVLKKKLLQYMLDKDTASANVLVHNANNALGIEELYTEIIQPVMQGVGELWHQNEISVAQEHYCSSFTQTLMLQFYNDLYDNPRINRKVVVACPDTELHQIGARMISDLFESKGWQSIFLGSAVPVQAIIRTLEEETPDVCALSLCMPEGLPACCKATKKIKEQFPDMLVAVGGRAFEQIDNPLQITGADIYSKNFQELYKQLEISYANH